MSWHSTWSSSQISNNDLKYLLSDLCKATNERWRLSQQTEKTFPVKTGNVAQPATTDIEGLPFSADGSTNDLKELLDAIVAAMKTMTPDFYTTSACTTAYTWSSVCSAVGLYSTTDTEDVQKFRAKSWWTNLKSILQLLRYAKFNAGISRSGSDEAHSDSTLPGAPDDSGVGATDASGVEDIWDSIGTESSEGGLINVVGYKMLGVYRPGSSLKYSDVVAVAASSVTISWDTDDILYGVVSRSYPPDKTCCVWTEFDVHVDGDINVYVGESLPALPSISGNFNGEAWSGTPDEIVTVGFGSADPDGTSNITTTIPSTCPALFPTTPSSGGVGADGFFFEVYAGVDTIRCGFDLDSSYGFPA